MNLPPVATRELDLAPLGRQDEQGGVIRLIDRDGRAPLPGHRSSG